MSKNENNDVAMRVFRFDPEISDSSHYDEFQIPFSKGLTILDALIFIYENLEKTTKKLIPFIY